MSGQSPAPSGAGDDPQSAFAPADASRRLADQLNTLSEVVETITYRLLELEERLAAQDLRLRALCEESAMDSPRPAAVEFRLDDTEERLLRIEAMLTGIAQSGTAAEDSRGFGAGSVSTWRQLGSGSGAVTGENDLDGPFPEDPEQPFLDELEGDSV
ncbi:hypothetical protein [Cyanobium sp. CH-040]|uniref:hypothetical protein n=1 Tax=Cyanobium sp. CH-040 TaxID=2823708 RepID=UPI0020CBAFA7|nr:hypothetical protein [Cyanobium sp. CH-040]MCP9929123.1 hypothetical protein [Cyanobium sp. CH-040]